MTLARMYLISVGLLKKIDYEAKISEREGKIPSIAGLATTAVLTTAVLTAVENKIPNISNLVMKTDYDSKMSGTESKYCTTSDYNKFTQYT